MPGQTPIFILSWTEVFLLSGALWCIWKHLSILCREECSTGEGTRVKFLLMARWKFFGKLNKKPRGKAGFLKGNCWCHKAEQTTRISLVTQQGGWPVWLGLWKSFCLGRETVLSEALGVYPCQGGSIQGKLGLEALMPAVGRFFKWACSCEFPVSLHGKAEIVFETSILLENSRLSPTLCLVQVKGGSPAVLLAWARPCHYKILYCSWTLGWNLTSQVPIVVLLR